MNFFLMPNASGSTLATMNVSPRPGPASAEPKPSLGTWHLAAAMLCLFFGLADAHRAEMASRLTSIANLTSLNSTISDQTAVAAQISLAALAILQGVGNPLSNLSTPALSASSTSSLSPPNLNASIQNLHSSSAVNGDARSGGAPSRHSPSASSTAHGNGSNGRFIPTSVSLPIHSPEELEAVNAFLLQLGRNVTGTNSNGTHSQSQSHLHPHSASTNHSSHGQPPRMQVNTQHLQTAPTENWFDPATLAQLGLAGLPGLPSAPSSDHQYSHSPNNYNSANVSRDYAALLRQLHLPDLSANATHHDNSMNHRPAYEYTHGRTPPPATLSPVSSSGSSHGHSFSHGGSGLPPHRLSPGSLYDHPVSASFPSHRHSDTQLKTSFGGSLRRNSAGHGSTSSGGILEHPGGVHGLAAPTLGQREGAGLLGSGVKGSLLLQASAKRFAAVQKVHEVTKEEEVEIDELADDSDEAVFAPAKEVPLVDVSVADDEEDKEERMSVDAPSPRAESVTMEDPDSPHFAPAASLAIDGGEEEEESRSTTPDSVASVHKPGHSLYPLLHEEGDPKFKLPALALGHHHHHHHPHQNGGLYADLTRALPSAGYRFDMSSTRSTSAMTEGTEVSSSAASTATATPRSRSPPPLSPPTSPSPRSSSRVVLPSLASVIAETTPAPSSIPASTAKSKVPEEERKRHALLIRNLLIFVNLEYMKQFGADAVARLKLRTSSSSVRSRSMTMEPSDEEEDGGEEELSGGEMELESPRVAVTAC